MTITIESMIAQIKALPRALVYGAAPDVAEAVHVALNQTINAGKTPEGEQWKPRQSDHGQPLQHAAAAVRVGAVGNRILIRVTGINAMHHRGIVKGGVTRRIILHDRITLRVAVAINRVLTKAFREATSGQ